MCCLLSLSAILCSDFLKQTAHQLTYHGLCRLNDTITDQQLCAFFRNNRFSTLYKYQVLSCLCVFVHTSVFLCVHVFICVCACVCAYVYMCLCVCVCVCVRACVRACLYVSMHVSVIVCACMLVFKWMCISVYIIPYGSKFS